MTPDTRTELTNLFKDLSHKIFETISGNDVPQGGFIVSTSPTAVKLATKTLEYYLMYSSGKLDTSQALPHADMIDGAQIKLQNSGLSKVGFLKALKSFVEEKKTGIIKS